MTPANITIGPATLGLDNPVNPSDEPWSSRTFRGRMAIDDAEALIAGMRMMPPTVHVLRVYGEPERAVMVRSIRTHAIEDAQPALAAEIDLVCFVPERPRPRLPA